MTLPRATSLLTRARFSTLPPISTETKKSVKCVGCVLQQLANGAVDALCQAARERPPTILVKGHGVTDHVEIAKLTRWLVFET